MNLVLVGTSHRLAPVEVRERVALDLDGSAELARRLADGGEEQDQLNQVLQKGPATATTARTATAATAMPVSSSPTAATTSGSAASTSRPVRSCLPTGTAPWSPRMPPRPPTTATAPSGCSRTATPASSTPSARRRATRRTAPPLRSAWPRRPAAHGRRQRYRAAPDGRRRRPRSTSAIPIRASTTSPATRPPGTCARPRRSGSRSSCRSARSRTATPAAGCRARARSCSRATTRTIRSSCAIRCTPTTPTAASSSSSPPIPKGVVGGMMWRAPEFKNEFAFFTMAKFRQQILVYRKIPGADKVLRWTIVKTIDAPGRPALLLLARGLHPQRPLVHLRQVSSSSEFFDRTDPEPAGDQRRRSAAPGRAAADQRPGTPRLRLDPEYFITAQGPFIYYNRLVPETDANPPLNDGVWRVDTGLGPAR